MLDLRKKVVKLTMIYLSLLCGIEIILRFLALNNDISVFDTLPCLYKIPKFINIDYSYIITKTLEFFKKANISNYLYYLKEQLSLKFWTTSVYLTQVQSKVIDVIIGDSITKKN